MNTLSGQDLRTLKKSNNNPTIKPETGIPLLEVEIDFFYTQFLAL